MAQYPGADWRPVVNHRAGGMRRPMMGITVHHAVGNLDSAEGRFNDPSSQASAHFGVAYDGSVRQWVDTDDAAFHACQANWTGWIGIEHESPSEGELFVPLTAQQVAATGGILKWLHDTEGVALEVTDDPGIPGIAYHSMVPGDCSVAWGITGCPGAPIIAQRGDIVAAAQGSPPTPKGAEMIYKALGTSKTNPAVVDGSLWVIVGQFPGGTLLVHAEETAAAYPSCPIQPVDGELLGQISKFVPSGTGAPAITSLKIALTGTAVPA